MSNAFDSAWYSSSSIVKNSLAWLGERGQDVRYLTRRTLTSRTYSLEKTMTGIMMMMLMATKVHCIAESRNLRRPYNVTVETSLPSKQSIYWDFLKRIRETTDQIKSCLVLYYFTTCSINTMSCYCTRKHFGLVS